jgi:hypothetical protein
MRRQNFLKVGLTGLAMLAAALVSQAGTLPADALPLPNRMGTADVVVLGKVTAIADKTVMAAPFPGAKNKIEYKIADVTINEVLKTQPGSKVALGGTPVRLAFVVLPKGVAIRPAPFQAQVGMEGVFFLTKHETGFYLAPGGLNFLNKNNQGFDKDLALLKRCAKIIKAPDTALKAKDAEERFLAAAMLLAKYRMRRSSNDKTEPIKAEQSKLILKALASADWTPSKDFTKLSPRMVLFKLPLTKKDGWEPPAGNDAKAFAAYAQKWLNDHADTYRIEKFVAKKTE